jgi:hypothetical protein
MKIEYYTSVLWVCGSSLFYLSLMLQCLDVICYYVPDVWVDAYYYPILYYLFWSNMYARAREGNGVY